MHKRDQNRTSRLASTIFGIVLAALIYGFFVIKKDDQEVGGDPFYTDKQLRQMEAAKA